MLYKVEIAILIFDQSKSFESVVNWSKINKFGLD